MRTAYNKTMKHTHRSLIIILAILFSACGPASPAPINLNHLELLPTPSGLETPPLRVAIAAVISPQGALESYSPLLDYLETKLGRPVERIQGSTYAETNEVLQSGLVDIAFVCTGAYIKGSAEFGMEILAVPEMDGESVYYSWVIVPANSSAQEVEDLRGSTFAFTDPLSLTGWMYPNYLLSQLGQRSEAFFSKTFFTYSHDRAIHAVADGFADGAAVDSLIFNYLIAREPSIAERVRVIHRSPAFGMPPVVVNPGIEPGLRAELQELLLNMPGDPDGLTALEALGIDRFVLTEDDLYNSAREVEAKVPLLPTVSP
jgi:phosphonate transport system substrate-binding protein